MGIHKSHKVRSTGHYGIIPALIRQTDLQLGQASRGAGIGQGALFGSGLDGKPPRQRFARGERIGRRLGRARAYQRTKAR